MAGTARGGVIAHSGAELMLVRFHRAGDGSEEARGELMTVTRDLAELFPDEWRELLEEATRERLETDKGERRRRRGRRHPR